MTDDAERIAEEYGEFLKVTDGDKTAAALLALAASVQCFVPGDQKVWFAPDPDADPIRVSVDRLD